MKRYLPARLLVLIAVAIACPLAQAATDYNWDLAGKIVVQSGGRAKPLDTFAREMVAEVFGKSHYVGQHPVETYFNWMSNGERWADEPLLYIPKGELRTRIGLGAWKGSYFSLRQIQQESHIMDVANEAMAVQQAGGKLSFTQSKAGELLNRAGTLTAVFNHELPLMVPVANGDPHATWKTMPQVMAKLDADSEGNASGMPSDSEQVLALAFSGMYQSMQDNNPEMFNTSARVFVSAQQEMLAGQHVLLSQMKWESLYNHVRPFFWARVVLVLGFLVYLVSLIPRWMMLRYSGLGMLVLGLILYTAGMGLRAYVAGRAPWSNMYESLTAIGWALVVISTIYELIKRERFVGMVACALGALILGVAEFASLDRGINPLVPALQSYWLNYHVITVLSSYACFAIAMGLGHAVLIAAIRNRGTVTPSVTKLANANLKIIQVGSMLLIGGILLGAVWANSSWGRFWGWDPKETWALICWFVYIILLHGRSAGWLGWRGLAISSVAVFPIVIMTYYGVNYYLSGLHSYGAGSSPSIPWQLFGYMGAEAVFLFWAITKLPTARRSPRRPPGSSSNAATETVQS